MTTSTAILDVAVLGGTGVSGREIVRELVVTTACRVRLGARSLQRAATEAAPSRRSVGKPRPQGPPVPRRGLPR